MLQAARTYLSNTAAVVVAVSLAVVFTGSVLGAEGRLPSRLLPEAVTLAVTSPVSPLPAARSHRPAR